MVLIVTFCLFQTLVWDILTFIYGDNKFYAVFQFMFAAYFTLLSVFLTSNIKLFRQFWKKHTVGKAILDKALHYCAVIMSYGITWILLLPDIFSGNYKKEYGKIGKQEAEKQVRGYDDMSLEARTLLPVGLLGTIMIIVVAMDILTEQSLSWIREILNVLVGMISLVFVIASVKETESL